MNFESKFKQERIADIEDKVEKVEAKIMFVKDLHDVVLNLDTNNNFDCKQLEALLWDKLTVHIESDEETVLAFDKIKREKDLRREIVTENERFKLLSLKEKNEVENIHRAFVNERIQNIYDINHDQNVKYLRQIIDYIDYLVGLRKERDTLKQLYEQDGEAIKKGGKFVDAVNVLINGMYTKYRQFALQNKTLGKSNNLGRANYGNYLKGVEFRGLGVGLVFNPRIQSRLRDFNDIAGRSWGCVSCRYDNDEDEMVHSHEYGHTLFGKHEAHIHLYAKRFISQIHKMVRDEDSKTASERLLKVIFGDFPAPIDSEKSKLEKIQSFILEYYKKLMGEIFADISNIFDHRLASGFWGHFQVSMDELDKYADQLKDEQLREVIRSSKKQLIETVNMYMENMAKLVYIGNKLDMSDDIIAGLLVFSGDTRKELRHLEKILGQEKFTEIISTFNPFVNKICRSASQLKAMEIVNDLSLAKENLPPFGSEN